MGLLGEISCERCKAEVIDQVSVSEQYRLVCCHFSALVVVSDRFHKRFDLAASIPELLTKTGMILQDSSA